MRGATARLGDVATIIRGITFKPEDIVPIDEDGAVACFRTKNIQAETDLSDVWGIPESMVRRSDQFVAEGDTLVSTANSWNLVGKCSLVPKLPFRATVGGFIAAVRANESRADPRYLYRWLTSASTQVALRSCGRQTTNISNLDLHRALDLAIPVPPLNEQRRLAAILDKADSIRARRRAALIFIDDFLSSTFLELSSGDTDNRFTTLGEISSVAGGLTINAGRVQGSQTAPYLRVANVYRNRLDLTELKEINLSYNELEAKALAADDILVVEGHGNPEEVGRAAVWNSSVTPCVHQNHLIRLRIDRKKANPHFVCAWINSAEGRAKFLRAGKTTSGLNTINIGQVRATEISLPVISQQEEYARISKAVGLIGGRLNSALAEADALYAALADRAFNGEL